MGELVGATVGSKVGPGLGCSLMPSACDGDCEASVGTGVGTEVPGVAASRSGTEAVMCRETSAWLCVGESLSTPNCSGTGVSVGAFVTAVGVPVGASVSAIGDEAAEGVTVGMDEGSTHCLEVSVGPGVGAEDGFSDTGSIVNDFSTE